MIDTLLQIFIWFIVFETLWFFIRWYLNYRADQQAERIVSEVMKDIRENYLPVYVETEGNLKLAYHHMTNDFISQGSTDTELWQRARERFPGKEIVIRETINGVPTFRNVKV